MLVNCHIHNFFKIDVIKHPNLLNRAKSINNLVITGNSDIKGKEVQYSRGADTFSPILS